MRNRLAILAVVLLTVGVPAAQGRWQDVQHLNGGSTCSSGDSPTACASGSCTFGSGSTSVTLTASIVGQTVCSANSGTDCPTGNPSSGCSASTTVTSQGQVAYSFGAGLSNRSVQVCQKWVQCTSDGLTCSSVATSCTTSFGLSGSGTISPAAFSANVTGNHVYQYQIMADEVTGVGACSCTVFCAGSCNGNCPSATLAASCAIWL